jgi:hypothetical protein
MWAKLRPWARIRHLCRRLWRSFWGLEYVRVIPVQVDEWYHIAVVSDGSEFQVYVNSTLTKSRLDRVRGLITDLWGAFWR